MSLLKTVCVWVYWRGNLQLPPRPGTAKQVFVPGFHHPQINSLFETPESESSQESVRQRKDVSENRKLNCERPPETLRQRKQPGRLRRTSSHLDAGPSGTFRRRLLPPGGIDALAETEAEATAVTSHALIGSSEPTPSWQRPRSGVYGTSAATD